jgi:isoquinoline 1-oxidoreductase beta subunit
MNSLRLHAARDASTSIDRRTFLKVMSATGAGLTLGIFAADNAAQVSGPGKTIGTAGTGEFAPNAFLRIKPDNTVTVLVKHVEMGQGTYTGLPTLVAEELDAAWSQVRVEGAPADAARYGNTIWREAYGVDAQGTGGSTAMANSFDQYRQAGAAARAMLVSAAAQKWNVPPESITVKAGTITHATGKKATFGELADAAAKVAVPQSVKTKDAKDYVYIGKSFARPDSKAKSTGTATFTQDVKLPDMLTAVVAHPPKFGATVKSFKAE